jgi:hypothetical protein
MTKYSLWLPVLIVTNRPRETRETPRTIPGGVWCILITPAAQKVATDAFNGFLGLPVTQKSGMWHWLRSQRPIWGRELAPSRLQPPTGGTDGIRPAAGSPTTPRGCRRDHACAGGGGARRVAGKRGGRRGGLSGGAGRPSPRVTPVPAAAMQENSSLLAMCVEEVVFWRVVVTKQGVLPTMRSPLSVKEYDQGATDSSSQGAMGLGVRSRIMMSQRASASA